MQIKDVLKTKGHEVADAQETDIVSAAVRSLADKRIGALVVRDRRQKMVGIFSERDLVRALARSGAEALGYAVADLMSKPVLTCRSGDRIDAVLARMTMSRVRHMPVVEGETVVGMISIGDLVHHRLDEKELEASTLLDLTRMRP